MSRMNITADPGLLYNISQLFTVLNITKKRICFTADSLPLLLKPVILVVHPLKKWTTTSIYKVL